MEISSQEQQQVDTLKRKTVLTSVENTMNGKEKGTDLDMDLENNRQVAINYLNTRIEKIFYTCGRVSEVGGTDSKGKHAAKSWLKFVDEVNTLSPLKDDDKSLDTGGQLWKVILRLAQCLREVKCAAEEIRVLQTTTKGNDMDILLNKDQETMLKRYMDIIMGYVAHCLIIPEFHIPDIDKSTMESAKKLSEEEHTISLETRFIRSEFILSLVHDFYQSTAPVFRRIIIKVPTETLIISFIQFLYYPIPDFSDPRDLAKVDLLQTKIDALYHNELLFKFPIRRTAKLFADNIARCEDELVEYCFRQATFVVLIPDDNFSRFIQGLVEPNRWEQECYLLHILIKTAMKDLEKDDETNALFCFGLQCVNLIKNKDLPLYVRKTAIWIASDLTSRHRDIGNRVVWEKILKQPLDIINSKSPVPCNVSEFLASLEVAEAILELPRNAEKWFYCFQYCWNGIFALYSTLCDKLDRQIVDVEMEKELGELRIALGKLIKKSLMDVYQNGHTNYNLAEYCVSIIINAGSNPPKHGKISPIVVQIQDNVSDVENSRYAFLRKPNESLAAGELASRLSNATGHLFKLVTEDADNQKEMLKDLFAQFLGFESTFDLEGKDKDVGMLASAYSRTCSSYELNEKQLKLDLLVYKTAQKYVGLLFLGEFGSNEHFFEELLNSIENDSDSFMFVRLVTERIEKEIGTLGDDTTVDNGEKAALVCTSLVQTLELIQNMCETARDKEKSRNKGTSPPSSAAEGSKDKMVHALSDWTNLDQLLTFLEIVKNLKAEFASMLGISELAEDLITIIRTRGRGTRVKLGQKPSKSPAGGKEKDDTATAQSLADVMFGMNSSHPFKVGASLVQLKKLIHRRHPGVEKQFVGILSILEKLLLSDEEYIYNHCINCFTSLTIDHHGKLIPRLIDLYAFKPKEDMDENMNLKYRLKCGEVLAKTFKSLGPISVIYINPVINAATFLSDEKYDVVLRASCYQVVCALVPQIGHKLEDHILQIWHWADQKLNVEKEELVRGSIWELLAHTLGVVIRLAESTHAIPPQNSAKFMKLAFNRAKVLESDNPHVVIAQGNILEISVEYMQELTMPKSSMPPELKMKGLNIG